MEHWASDWETDMREYLVEAKTDLLLSRQRLHEAFIHALKDLAMALLLAWFATVVTGWNILTGSAVGIWVGLFCAWAHGCVLDIRLQLLILKNINTVRLALDKIESGR